MTRPFIAVAAALVLFGSIVLSSRLHAAGPAVVYLNQGWDRATAERYYHESQGAVLLPAAFMRALRTRNGRHFLNPAHMATFHFLPGTNGVYPLGMSDDNGSKSGGIPMVGLTCAACHTGQLSYRGTNVRIDGGSADLDIGAFIIAMRRALARTAADPTMRRAFLNEAVAAGYPKATVVAGLDAEIARDAFVAKAGARLRGPQTPGGPGIVDALTGIAFNAMTLGLHQEDNARRALAPTNYPPLWDIWRFDWVQYNASVQQPMARNVGEDIGLGARLNIVDSVTGRLNPESTRWKSTIRVRNLFWIENALTKLKPPPWPTAFGAIDAARAAKGRALFAITCARCHGVTTIIGTNEWYLRVLPLSVIGTDPNQAVGFAKMTYNATKLGLGANTGGPEGLSYVVEHVKKQAYIDDGIPKREWPIYDGWGRPAPIIAPCGYKARPLVGIWSTPPFLHNGSVPSVFDLLSDTRPAHPILGNPEFDPVKLGLVQHQIPGVTYMMDTTQQGNGNSGHWFTNDTTRKGRIGPKLSNIQKFELIEYLKSATYATYPISRIHAAAIPPLPCVNKRNWAAELPY